MAAHLRSGSLRDVPPVGRGRIEEQHVIGVAGHEAVIPRFLIRRYRLPDPSMANPPFALAQRLILREMAEGGRCDKAAETSLLVSALFGTGCA